MKIVRTGLSPWQAVRMGIVNKTFDVFEKEIVEDVVRTRIPQAGPGKMFMENKENESLKISAKLVDLEDAEEF